MRAKLSRWHRRLGLASLALLAWLAVSGVLLNHSHEFGLDRPIGVPAVARLYGIKADCAEAGWVLDDSLLIDCQQTLLLDGRPLDDVTGPVRGALIWQDLQFIAASQALHVFTAQGERVETLGASLLPGAPQRLGHSGERLVLRTGAGLFASDAELLQWRSLEDDGAVIWAASRPVDPSALERARAHAAVRQLTWTKLVQDLHSGRIIGTAGALLADLGALAIILLAALGLIMSRRAGRRRRRRAKAPAPAARADTPNA